MPFRRHLIAALALLPLGSVALAQTARAQTVPAPPAAATPLPAPPPSANVGALVQTPQDRADIARIETYLNGLKALRAHFLQVAPDGGLSEGTAWLERPGRMRFQYDPPSPFLLLSSHGVLTFNDASLQQTSNIPLSRTPLGILLADKVTLAGAVTVTGIAHLPGQLQVTVVRTDSPGDGSLTLIFADQPLALKQWTVVDAQRKETHVTLFNVQFTAGFDQRLFEQVVVPADLLKSGG